MAEEHERDAASTDSQGGGSDMRRMYLRFGGMIATSTVVTYLVEDDNYMRGMIPHHSTRDRRDGVAARRHRRQR